jgi:predicted N-formylglutamate amidohydrolase
MTDTIAPFETIPATQDVPLFIFGDHASRTIPPKLDNLGLRGKDLTRHIAWDIGTETLIRCLCAHFGCGGQLASISRLVVDLNRPPDMVDIIPHESDGTQITGNHSLSERDRNDRITDYHAPYHTALGEALGKLTDPFVISVHSFTPEPRNGERRAVDFGLLIKHDWPSAEKFSQNLRTTKPDLNIGMNKPYSAHDLNYTIDRHAAPRGLRHLAIEVRQDHIPTDDKAQAMAAFLAPQITPLLNL